MRRIICPNAKNCTIYEYWIDQAGGQRIGIISESGEGTDRSYSCLALDVYNDRDLEGGVVSDEEGHLEMFITNGIEDVLPEDHGQEQGEPAGERRDLICRMRSTGSS